MSDLLYAHVDAPAPPQELINQAWFFKKNIIVGIEHRDVHYDLGRPSYRILVKDGESHVNAFANTHLFTKDESQWVYNNVTDTFNDVRISLTTVGNRFNGPHIDTTRDFTLIYLLDKGGPDPTTVIYKENNVDGLIKPRGYCVDDYSMVTPIMRVKANVNQWHLINGRVLHSIENIPDGRLAIQISFDTAKDIEKLKFYTKIYS